MPYRLKCVCRDAHLMRTLRAPSPTTAWKPSSGSFVNRDQHPTVVPPLCATPRTHSMRRKVIHDTRPTNRFLGRSGAPENRSLTILETTRRVEHFHGVRWLRPNPAVSKSEHWAGIEYFHLNHSPSLDITDAFRHDPSDPRVNVLKRKAALPEGVSESTVQ